METARQSIIGSYGSLCKMEAINTNVNWITHIPAPIHVNCFLHYQQFLKANEKIDIDYVKCEL